MSTDKPTPPPRYTDRERRVLEQLSRELERLINEHRSTNSAWLCGRCKDMFIAPPVDHRLVEAIDEARRLGVLP